MRLPFLTPDDVTIKTVKQQIIAARKAHAILENAKRAGEIAIEKASQQEWRC